MMLDPGCHRGQHDLGQNRCAGPDASSRRSLAILAEVGPAVSTHGARRMPSRHPSICNQLHPVLALAELELCHRAQVLDHQRWILGLGVESRADRRFRPIPRSRRSSAVRTIRSRLRSNGVPVRGELLAKAGSASRSWRWVAGLISRFPSQCLALRRETPRAEPRGAASVIVASCDIRPTRRIARGDHVIRRLRHVDGDRLDAPACTRPGLPPSSSLARFARDLVCNSCCVRKCRPRPG